MRTSLLPVVLAMLASSASADPAKLVVGIYVPSVEFGTAQARLAYVQGLAKAIEGATGIKTEAQSYANVAALRKDAVDLAILDGQCYAADPRGRLVATATIGGATTRAFALYASTPDMLSLKGKTLAFVSTGCNDAAFVDHAMLDSEVDGGFFGARTGKPDLTAAIAEVASYKAAHAVFAPVGTAKGLTKLFDAGLVPNPALVTPSGKLPEPLVDKIAAAVIGYGGGGAIGGWTRPSRDIYANLAARFARTSKAGVLANPEPVRLDARDVLLEPPTLRDTAVVELRHHFIRAGERME
ncbi:MAG: hypothetical protein NT062_19950 [Proteobacteria bacterium]|nr:hypothetical protein [Pseudomonadota bacterium]